VILLLVHPCSTTRLNELRKVYSDEIVLETFPLEPDGTRMAPQLGSVVVTARDCDGYRRERSDSGEPADIRQWSPQDVSTTQVVEVGSARGKRLRRGRSRVPSD
jgi:hypothetical protein